MTYKGDPSSEIIHAMIGKGVIFDTGGLNLKPTGFMEDMYVDKGGASAVFGAFKGIVEAGLKVNVTVTIPLAENSVGNNSYRPSDIIVSKKGLTVEITNTDAEGRLILADAYTYTQQKYKIDSLIELSTLTGACMIALGTHYAGIFSNNADLSKSLITNGAHIGERIWELPIYDEIRDDMKGKASDLVNSAGSRYGGASQGAAFLENFVEEGVKWAHVDIAGYIKLNSSLANILDLLTTRLLTNITKQEPLDSESDF
jgi:leucyl aminopeptidase